MASCAPSCSSGTTTRAARRWAAARCWACVHGCMAAAQLHRVHCTVAAASAHGKTKPSPLLPSMRTCKRAHHGRAVSPRLQPPTPTPTPSHAPLHAPHPQVSGYIDLSQRLVADGGGMEAVFGRKKRLMPRPTDLSFYNWETHLATSNPTPNFQVGSWAHLLPRGATPCLPGMSCCSPACLRCPCLLESLCARLGPRTC